jgi:DNA polymerase-1
MAKNAASVAKTRGHVKTLMGRQIRFPGGQFTHKASGLIYQGTSADLNKDCIIRICEYLESECPDAHLLLNIHDEFNISMPYVETKHLFELQKVIQDRPELRVPIRVDFGCPKENWWEATQADSLTNAH